MTERPIFYWAQGTQYAWNWFGVKIGGGSTVSIGSNGVLVPDELVTENPAYPNIYVKGVTGNVLWEGGPAYDPLPKMLDTGLWQYKRVPYPASILFIGPSIEEGVEWMIDEIESNPIGTPFALGGFSQGAAVMSRVYNELRGGLLKDRRPDLRAMVTFGNPMRQAGHTFPGSSGYSGACDIASDTTTGHGFFPAGEDIGLLAPYVRKFARLQNTEDLVWDFTMPNEVITGVGDSDDGKFLQRFGKDMLRNPPFIGVAEMAKAMGVLWRNLGVAPSTVDRGTGADANSFKVVDPETGAVSYKAGGGHVMYPFYPPPNADGTFDLSGDTCYQLAAKYLNRVGERIYDELNPTFVAPVVRTGSFGWFSSLPGE